HSSKLHHPPAISPPIAPPSTTQPSAASGRVAAITAATNPIANTTLVSLSATAAPTRTPARIWNMGGGWSDDAMRINAAMIGSDRAISAKLVPTSESVMGPNAASRTEAARQAALA